MRPRLRVLAAVLVACGAVPASAAADAPWSMPAPVGPLSETAAEPSLTFDREGRALVSARLGVFQPTGRAREAVQLFAGPAPGGLTPLASGLHLEAPPIAFATRAVAFLRAPAGSGISPIVGTSFGATTTGAGAFRELIIHAEPGTAAFDVNARGEGALVWVERRGDHDLLRLALRRPGEAFRRVGDLRGTGLITAPTVAIGPAGDVVVAYQRNARNPSPPTPAVRHVEARLARRGHGFGAVQTLGSSAGVSEIVAAVAPSGRTTVAWGTQDGGEEANLPWVVRAAVRPAGGSGTFRAAQVLDPGEGIARPSGRLDVAIDAAGAATVLWSGIAGARFPYTYPVSVATQDATARFGARAVLAPNGAAGDLAAGPQGDLLAVWGDPEATGNEQQSEHIAGAVRTGGAWGAPEAISPRERAGFPRAAYDPVSGRPSVVWIAQPGAPPIGQPPYVTPMAVRLATRG